MTLPSFIKTSKTSSKYEMLSPKKNKRSTKPVLHKQVPKQVLHKHVQHTQLSPTINYGKIDATVIEESTKHGQIDVLEFWKNQKGFFKYKPSQCEMVYMLRRKLEVSPMIPIKSLEWWYNSKLIENFHSAVNISYLASKNGNIKVLEWWKNTYEGKPIPKNENWCHITTASSCRQIEALEWWKNSGLKLEYTDQAIDFATQTVQVDVLEWWKNSGLELKYTGLGLDILLDNLNNGNDSCIRVIEWWINSGLKLKYSMDVTAELNRRRNSLKVWEKICLDLKNREIEDRKIEDKSDLKPIMNLV